MALNQPDDLLAGFDPIVDEIRAIRAKISAEYGNDRVKLGEALRAIQQQFKDRVVPAPGDIRKQAS